ncbi:MAG: ECF transporter S component [Erysipelotrichaceae bacterium]|nr:ECF transporter S component [Erysipelotrichaceae bacterium]MDY5252106.1 ECF transporter S component [Erysipelotrichaceae bacterium]
MKIKKLTLSALFLALGLILPFVTGQIPQIGSMLLPMHLPILLCGMICGWQYGLIIGLILPALRFALFQMPPLVPIGIAMTFELATYGAISGFILQKFGHDLKNIYFALLSAMLAGRIIWGIVSSFITTITLEIFIASGFINAIPGIILQLILIPMITKIYYDHARK